MNMMIRKRGAAAKAGNSSSTNCSSKFRVRAVLIVVSSSAGNPQRFDV